MNLFILFGISSICSTDVIPNQTIVALTTSPRKFLAYVAAVPNNADQKAAESVAQAVAPQISTTTPIKMARKRKLSNTPPENGHKFKQTKISTFFSRPVAKQQQDHKKPKPNEPALAEEPPNRLVSVESIAVTTVASVEKQQHELIVSAASSSKKKRRKSIASPFLSAAASRSIEKQRRNSIMSAASCSSSSVGKQRRKSIASLNSSILASINDAAAITSLETKRRESIVSTASKSSRRSSVEKQRRESIASMNSSISIEKQRRESIVSATSSSSSSVEKQRRESITSLNSSISIEKQRREPIVSSASNSSVEKQRRESIASLSSSISASQPIQKFKSLNKELPPLPFVRLERLSVAKMLERANCTAGASIAAQYDDSEYDTISTDWLISKIHILQELTNASDALKSPTATSSTTKKNEYTVEEIIEINEIGAQPFFRVKWQDYTDEHNTWEPLGNVRECQTLFDFLLKQTQSYRHCIDALIARLRHEYSVAVEVRKAKADYTRSLRLLDDFDLQKLQADLILLAFIPLRRESKSYLTISKRAAHMVRLLPLYFRRTEQALQLRIFEQRINATDKSSNLTVENVVDFEGPPTDFTYINEILPGDGVVIPSDPFIGCDCGPNGCGYRMKECCGRNSGSEFAYDYKRRIRVPPGTPVFECNKRCSCGPDCQNRVVQQGRTHSLCIFKTANGCGWGVRTLRTIYEGQFICEYVGEIITYEETERRGAAYDAAGRTYLFDLDMNSNDNPYTIDAAHHGNVSHFINHSCSPNCGVWAVWVDCLDMDLPRICLFALRRIAAGEELNFDYLNQSANGAAVTMNAMVTIENENNEDEIEVVDVKEEIANAGNIGNEVRDDDDDDKNKSQVTNKDIVAAAAPPKVHRMYGGRKIAGVMECRCQAPNCRKFLF